MSLHATKVIVIVIFLFCFLSLSAQTVKAKEEVQQKPNIETEKIVEQKVPEFLYYRYGEKEKLIEQYNAGKVVAEKKWQEQQASLGKIKNLQTSKLLEIIPVSEFYAANKELNGEPGVSYLIKTDEVSILFDVGFNMEKENPSPLEHNMQKLGITTEDFEVIVISHNHVDHVGGEAWSDKNTFSFGNKQIELKGKKIYTPIPMNYPNTTPIYAENPTVIAKGIATIGTIYSQQFFGGLTGEQALAVNVEGKGIVLIVGCGHQGIEKIIARTKLLFNEPVYAIIGGLHFPVTGSRIKIWGEDVQKYVGTGKLPWIPVTNKDVQEAIEIMKPLNLKLIAISPHDSCDESLNTFSKAFPKAYRAIKVGEKISISRN